MRVVCIIQARMGSSRLPGKVLLPLLGRTMLERVIERVALAKTVSAIVVATSDQQSDDCIASVGSESGVTVFRGDEADVLGRYAGAARVSGAEVIVRVTSDCPLLDPGVLDEIVSAYVKNPDGLDYVSNTIERTYPRGLDVEALPMRVIEHLEHVAPSMEEREHVTLHLLRNQAQFRIAQVRYPIDCSDHYWTVDTAQDFRLVERIYEGLYPRNPLFSWTEVLALFRTFPDLYGINRSEAELKEARLRAIDRG